LFLLSPFFGSIDLFVNVNYLFVFVATTGGTDNMRLFWLVAVFAVVGANLLQGVV